MKGHFETFVLSNYEAFELHEHAQFITAEATGAGNLVQVVVFHNDQDDTEAVSEG